MPGKGLKGVAPGRPRAAGKYGVGGLLFASRVMYSVHEVPSPQPRMARRGAQATKTCVYLGRNFLGLGGVRVVCLCLQESGYSATLRAAMLCCCAFSHTLWLLTRAYLFLLRLLFAASAPRTWLLARTQGQWRTRGWGSASPAVRVFGWMKVIPKIPKWGIITKRIFQSGVISKSS